MEIENKPGSESFSLQSEKMRFGAMLAFFSVFVTVEGIARFISSNPSQDSSLLDGDDNTYPPIITIIASTGEVVFGAMGLLVGVSQFAFGYSNSAISMAALASMLILGWFVFFNYAIAIPIFNDDKGNPPPVFRAGALSSSEQDAALVFGHMFASISYCGIMQGFQFYTCLYLYNLQSGNHETTNSRNKGRLFWYSFLLFLGGMGNFVLGCIVYDAEDGGKLDSTYIYPPNIISYPGLTIASGLFILAYAVLVLLTAFNSNMASVVKMAAPLVWLFLCTGHVMTQLSVAGTGFAAGGCQIIVLSISLVVGPAFLAHLEQNPPLTTN